MLTYKTYVLLDVFETNTYLIWDDVSKEAILIDPSAPSESLKKEITQKDLHLKMIITTHGHGDHIGGNQYFSSAFSCPIGIHPLDADMLTNPAENLSSLMNGALVSPAATISLVDDYHLTLGKHDVYIYHTPGHTRGGIVVYAQPYLFSGDTIFDHEVGRCDLPGGNLNTLITSIRSKVFCLPDETLILPGHGPSSTVGVEKVENPYAGLGVR